MPRFAANLSLMFTEEPFLDRFESASKAGFQAVEFLFPYAFSIEDLTARLDEYGLEVVLFNLPPGHWDEGERGVTALKGREAEFSLGLDLGLKYAEALRCQRLHAMAGLRKHGADPQVYRANLQLAAEWARELGKTVLIEPINTFDMPDYFLSKTEEASTIIKDIGVLNLGIQFAHPLDRSEPSRDVLDYEEVFEAIDATGFNGWIGCEYKPRGKTLEGLGWMAPWREQRY